MIDKTVEIRFTRRELETIHAALLLAREYELGDRIRRVVENDLLWE